MALTQDRSEIVFFDVETIVPGSAIIEFGAILVCPKKLTELDHYSTLVRPADPSHISHLSDRSNGITRNDVASSRTFADIADTVYDLLHERIWAGHNIIRHDCVCVRDAFVEINRPAPEPKGIIDSLVLLTQKFGRRAGDMKMATLATHFGLGRQTHRSLDDVRMNLEVLKCCGGVLLLESSPPDVFPVNSWVSPNATTRSRSNGKSLPDGGSPDMKNEPVSLALPANPSQGKNHTSFSLPMCSSEGAQTNMVDANSFRMRPLCDDLEGESVQLDVTIDEIPIQGESIQLDVTIDEIPIQGSPQMSSPAAASASCNSSIFVLEPDEIFIPSISASLVPPYHGSQRIQLLHKGVSFQLSCTRLKVRYGVRAKFFDHANRPKLSFVIDPSPSLCKVLDACNGIAQRLSVESGSSSEWRPLVTRKDGFFNSPTVRLHIPTAVFGNVAIYATEIYQRESSGTVQRLLFSKFDAEELGSLFKPGTFVDAVFSLDPYDYRQHAGVRLVAKN